jgi:serine/threonine protein kinase
VLQHLYDRKVFDKDDSNVIVYNDQCVREAVERELGLEGGYIAVGNHGFVYKVDNEAWKVTINITGLKKGKWFDLTGNEQTILSKIRGIKNVVQLNDIDSHNVGNFRLTIIKFPFYRVTLQQYMAEEKDKQMEGIRLYKILRRTLQNVHDKNIVHSDLSPDQILMNGEQPVIIDWGAAYGVSPYDSDNEKKGLATGTAPYQSTRVMDNYAPRAKDDMESLGFVMGQVMGYRVPHDRRAKEEYKQKHPKLFS